MSSMRKPTMFAVVRTVAVASVAGAATAHAQATPTTTTTTTTAVPVNLDQNIVTIVLIMGVSVALTLLYGLSKLIPKIRSGEVSFSKIDFDWRAQLLNQTSKKEKARRAEEKASRQQRLTEEHPVDFEDFGTQYHQNELPSGEKRVQVEVFVPEHNRETH